MAVKIKLKRLGKIRAPYYRIIVTDARTKRDGRPIEEIGKYAPKEHPSFIEVNSERVQHWLSVGAQPTEPVQAILRKTGDWQRFKGQALPKPIQVAEEKPDKKAVFEEAAKEAQAEGDQGKQAKGKKSEGKKSEGKKSGGEKSGGEKSGGEKSGGEKSGGETKSADKSAGAQAAEPTAEESSPSEDQAESARSEG